MDRRRRYERAALAAIGLWLVACLATVGYNGPSHEEAWSISNGLWVLRSRGMIGWSAASPLWPPLAALAYIIGGLVGARILALSMMGIAVAAAARATQNLFGAQAGFWATVALAANGLLLALSRQAVPEAPAAAGVAVSLMAVTELAQRNHRAWLLVAVLAFVFACLNAWPAAFMAFPLLAVLFSLRPQRAALDSGIAGVMLLAAACVALPSLYGQAARVAGATWSALPAPQPSGPLEAWFGRVYALSGPLPLAVAGGFVARRRGRLVAVLLGGLLLWPAYHALTGNSIAEQARTVLGLLFASPLMGLALATLWGHILGRPVALAATMGLALLALVQVGQLERGWADVREVGVYLTRAVRPGDRLLSNDPWPFALSLYAEGHIQSLWDISTTEDLARGGTASALCDFDWFVSVEGVGSGSEEIAAAVRDCGTYVPAYATSTTAIRLGPDLRYLAYPVRITVWRNAAGR